MLLRGRNKTILTNTIMRKKRIIPMLHLKIEENEDDTTNSNNVNDLYKKK